MEANIIQFSNLSRVIETMKMWETNLFYCYVNANYVHLWHS